MKVGIGLPNAVRGVDRAGIVDWAQRAEAAGFSSLGTIDRIAYPNYESLIALAAAAAVTERIQLVTDILISPLRSNTALLAKQAATIDHLSGGRLVLGLAPGGREDDYAVSGVDFHGRGKILDEQLPSDEGDLGGRDERRPGARAAGGPVILIGGSSPTTPSGAPPEHGDGWTMGGGTPDMFAEALASLHEAWKAAGRDGEPQTMVLFYFALGDDGARWRPATSATTTRSSATTRRSVVDSAAKDADTVKAYLEAFEQAGCDEVDLLPGEPGSGAGGPAG